MIDLVISLFDCIHVRITAANENVIQKGFPRAGTFEGLVDAPDIVLERAAKNGYECELEIRARFAVDVGFEVTMMALLVGVFQDGKFQGSDMG